MRKNDSIDYDNLTYGLPPIAPSRQKGKKHDKSHKNYSHKKYKKYKNNSVKPNDFYPKKKNDIASNQWIG